jgi:hypothetical protein
MSWNITGAPGIGEDLLYSQAGTPTLDLRFASSKNLNDYVSGQNLITYTRAGNATFFDANGTIQTAGANTPRFDHNPATGESLGLLIEEARTNLLLNSETLATQSVTVTAAAHTLSFYGTGTVTLSGTHSATVVGTGAFPTRTTLTFTPTSGSLTVTVSGTVQYAQVELGAFTTSWISTAGATATRNADAAQITGTNFSRWYSQSAGTLLGLAIRNYDPPSAGTTAFPRIASLSPGNSNAELFELASAGSVPAEQCAAFVANNQVVNMLHAPIVLSGQQIRFAGAYRLDDYASSRNGSTVQTDTSGGVPRVSNLRIGDRWDSARTWNGTISRLAYFDRRLPNATLQAITA